MDAIKDCAADIVSLKRDVAMIPKHANSDSQSNKTQFQFSNASFKTFCWGGRLTTILRTLRWLFGYLEEGISIESKNNFY